MNPDDPLLRLRYLKETGQNDEAAKYEEYLTATGQMPKAKPAQPAAKRAPLPGQHGNEIIDASPETSYAQEALGGVAALSKDIPGAEALQAGARSLFRGMPYKNALSDIRGAEDAAPKWVRRGNRVIGGTVAAAVAPGNVLSQGALYGVTGGLLQADPSTVEERLHEGAKQGVIGAAAGKVGQMIGTGLRTVAASTLGKIALARKAAMSAADNAAYGKAAQEGALAAADPTPQAVNDVMADADIAPYIAAIKGSRIFKGADDATVLREAYKLMSEKQGLLANRAASSPDFKAGTSLEKAEITSAKHSLLDAADEIMPSFRPAVQGHAEHAGQMEAFRAGADAAVAITKGSSGAGKRIEKTSAEAFMKSILEMSPAQAKAAKEGLLGRLKEKTGLLGATTVNPLTMFGMPNSARNLQRIAPFLEALDKQAGAEMPGLFRSAPIGATGLLAR
jgi:hypothetical protein